MKPYGKGTQRVLVVGEAPGQAEDERGRPFAGTTGAFLRTTLERIGIDLDKAALSTNSLICKTHHHAPPDPKQIQHCLPNLQKTIQEFQPRVIIPLGRHALSSVLQGIWKDDVGVMDRWAGWQIPFEKYWICPTYHPAYLMRMKNAQLDKSFGAHLEAAFDIDEDPPTQEDWKEQIQVLFDEDEIVEAIRAMRKRGGQVAVDYETNCLKPDYPKARLVSCALSNGEETVAYPWSGEAILATRELLMDPRIGKISSNLKMEDRWTIQQFGQGVACWAWDTMLATHCLDNRPGICSLKFQALVRLGVPSYNDHLEPFLSSRGHYNRVKEIDLGQLLLYNGMDSLLEHRLAMLQQKELGYVWR